MRYMEDLYRVAGGWVGGCMGGAVQGALIGM